MLEPTSSRSASPCPADPVPGRGGLSAGGVPERALFQAGQSRISPPGCREPSGLLPTMQWLPRSGLTPGRAGSRCRHVRGTSFLPAVPPTCHKQRSPAVSSGHSRSLRGGRWAGCMPLTWGGGGGRNCMACMGSNRVGWLSLPVLGHAAGTVPRVAATGPPSSVASSGGPPPAARPTTCPGRARPAGGR
jgi:hypothetical protein